MYNIILKKADIDDLLTVGAILLILYLLVSPRISYAAKTARKGGGGGKALVNKGGRVLKAPKVKLIIWGNHPLAAQIDYYNVLTEYGAGKPVYQGMVYSKVALPSAINDTNMANMIGSMITAGQVPDFRKTGDMVYVVIPSPGAKNADKTGDAYNTNFSWGGSKNGVLATYYGKSDIISITRAMSEEIAEAITDPGPTPAWEAGPDSLIGDPCSTPFKVNGVTVEGLWSNAKRACTTAAG
jgi:hypothetical protein